MEDTPSQLQGLGKEKSQEAAWHAISLDQVLRNATTSASCQTEPSCRVEKEYTPPRVTPHPLLWAPIAAFLPKASPEQITNQTVGRKGLMLNAKGKELNRSS